ncbi:MAG: peptidylprolyl isomerase [Chloroflexota bacterium]|nr:peptidylprolyl isomerase [Chloroflexota bacterium]
MDRFRDKLPINDTLRNRLGRPQPQHPGQRRRISRREREARQRRRIILGMAITAVAIVVILITGLVLENFVKPRAVLAEVGGEEITRREYWQYSAVQLYTQARQYEQFAATAQGDQQAQMLSFAASLDAQRREVWGSTDVNDQIMQQMIDDQIYLQGAEEMGLPITEQEVDAFILNQWAAPDSPLITPTPEPTLIPQRAEWATQTAEAGLPQPPATPASTPGATPLVSPQATTNPSPTSGTPTPDLSEARAQATENYEDFAEAVFEDANMSREDYERLWVRGQVARQKVTDALHSQVGQTAEQVNAAHILVGTQELANQLYEQVTSGANFAEVARVSSTDTATSPNGGDLGWFTRSEMVPEFAEVAFSTQPGQISRPVQTQFGWHIIKVNAHEQDRAVTDAQLNTLRTEAVDSWLAEQRSQLEIDSEYLPTPTPTPAQFEPPVAAPTPAIVTPVASPAGTPPTTVIGPEFPTPLASPPPATPAS